MLLKRSEEKIAAEIGFPVVVRSAYTMGGQGGRVCLQTRNTNASVRAFCYNVEELRTIVANGLDLSMTHQCLIEESILGIPRLPCRNDNSSSCPQFTCLLGNATSVLRYSERFSVSWSGRVFHSENEFARGKCHVNGIENFWSFAKRRLAKFNGCDSDKFVIHLMECEWRYNHRNEDLFKELAKILKRY